MKYSIKRQMAVAFIGLALFILIIFLSINAFFLEKYYRVNKQKELKKMHTTIEVALENDTLATGEVKAELEHLVETSNISFVVLDETGREIIWSEREAGSLKLQLMGYLLDKTKVAEYPLESTENYEISKIKDSEKKIDYLEMWGHFSNNYSFIMRTPLESIRESADISNRFLMYVGIGVMIISIIFVWFFSKKITDPIMELAELSKKMADLDFNAKYTRGGSDELGVLGTNFNTMSEKLQLTISELKTANNELQKDIEKKEQIETMRTEFLSNVSHELKTPIALIQGYSEGLKEVVNDDAQSREFYCEVIMDEANKMNQMVKSLLTLNQLEFGKDSLAMERFDLVALTKGVLLSCDILIQQKEVNVNFQQKEPIYVWADEFKVEQVIRNYMSNALNHIDKDKVMDLKIVRNGEKARFSIFNTGDPIPQEDINRIWDKFYKVDKARTRAYGGNGIGLSIVKVIMESFHQKYGVENYDNGVMFWFELDTK